MRKKILSILCPLSFIVQAMATEIYQEPLYFEITSENEHTVRVSSLAENFYYEKLEINIPSTINYNEQIYHVTAIGNNAFTDAEISSVIISSGITTIGEEAFYNCQNLTHVEIPNSVTLIEYAAFCDCISLVSLALPNSLTSETVYSGAFNRCEGLTSLTLPETMENINRNVFAGCSNLTSVTMPQNMDVQNSYLYITKDGIRYRILNGHEVEVSFGDYSGNLVIPPTITAGNTYNVVSISFLGNNNSLSSITIPNSVTKIEDGAFMNCSKLSSVTMPEDLDVSKGKLVYTAPDGFKYYIFSGSKAAVTSYKGSDENVSIPNSISFGNQLDIIYIESKTFVTLSNLQSITIPPNIIAIKNNAIVSCNNLKKIICLTEMPPSMLSQTFDANDITLVVPCDKIQWYTNSETWNIFKTIQCLDEETDDNIETIINDNTAIKTTTASRTVLVVNQQIIVNGEIPDYVLSPTGQKIKNKNLKAGMYVAVTENEMISVLVR